MDDTEPIEDVIERPRPKFWQWSGPEHSPLLQFVRRRRVRTIVAVVLVALLGAGIGLTLGATVHHKVGPVDATFRLRAGAGGGGTRVDVPPLGKIVLHDHKGPLKLRINIDQVSLPDVQQLISSTQSTDEIGDTLASDVHTALIELAVRAALCAVGGAVVLTFLVFRRPWPALGALGVSLAMLAYGGAYAAGSFRTAALTEPKFSGILASAPAAIGDVQDIEARFTAYRAELAKLVTNVSKLYDVASGLPAAVPSAGTTAVLWVADIHDNPEAFSVMQSLIQQFNVAAVVDSGDLSDHGTAAENTLYAPIAGLGVPYVYVKGNHDSQEHTVAALERIKNVTVLDNNEATVAGLRFVGIGDPRFTPDKTVQTSDQDAMLTAYGKRLALTAQATDADVAVIHDPAMAGPLMGNVALVLAGHLHHRDVQTGNGTLLLTQGSTGGAGLRNLEGSEPLPLDASVLYFDSTTHKLIAYDDVTVGGLGLTSVEIQRHAVSREIKGGTNPVPPPPSAGPSAPASAPASAPPSGSPAPSGTAPAAGAVTPSATSSVSR